MNADADDALVDPDGETDTATLFKRALALRRAERRQDAVNCLDEVLRRLDAAGEENDLQRRAMIVKIRCLDEAQQPAETVLACDAFLSRYEGDTADDAVGLAADVLWLKAKALNLSGEKEKERAVRQELLSNYSDEPQARGPVAGAMYNEGIFLRDADRGAEAVAIWDALWRQFSKDPPKAAPFVPIRGQLAKSTYLARLGQLDQALATCEQMLRECRRRSLPEDEVRTAQRRCVAIAQREHSRLRRARRFLRRG